MKLTPAQKRLLSIAKGMADLGLPAERVPEGFERCFTASGIITDGRQIRTLRALIRKGVIEVAGTIRYRGGEDDTDIVLRIQEAK